MSELTSLSLRKEKVLTQSFFISAGDCNAEKELSLTLLTSKLIDIATKHANMLGIGNPYMPNDHCGWVLTRLSIEMDTLPVMDSDYSISTWVESWNKHFSERAFRIALSDGTPVGYARSIWMVLDTETRVNSGLEELPFNEEYISDIECPIQRQAKHRLILLPDEDGADSARVNKATHELRSYTFQYCDLDAYRHVNTVRYVALLMNQFPLDLHDKKRVSRMELSFLHEGEYGKEIEILRSDLADSHDCSTFLLRKSSDKTPILYSRVFFKDR